MSVTFPFGLPAATTFYLVLYLGTLFLHVLFMNYVLAGSIVVSVTSLLRRPGDERMRAVLIDWIPSMLSGAITAGIAPLLFVQILYQEEFYSANLLLSHRWMSILPVLIVGSYGLAVQKSAWAKRQSSRVRFLLSLVPLGALLFTAYSWSENHLLSLRPTSEWASFYTSAHLFYSEAQLLPRVLLWIAGAFPTCAVILGWQLWYREERSARPLATLALGGIAATLVAAFGFDHTSGGAVRGIFLGQMARPYFVLACSGLAVQVIAWGLARFRGLLAARELIAASVGVSMTILGVSVCRECLRLEALGEARLMVLAQHHAEALTKEGFIVFAACLALVSLAIAAIFLIVRSRPRGAVHPVN